MCSSFRRLRDEVNSKNATSAAKAAVTTPHMSSVAPSIMSERAFTTLAGTNVSRYQFCGAMGVYTA